MPVLWLTLAEIEEWEGNGVKKNEYVQIFLDEMQKSGYGDMYNKYLIEIYLEELKDPAKALAIADKEVNNRPTPETFDWLAWVLYKQGENEKAFSFAKNNVNRQTFEPDAVLHTALIFAANGKKREARLMLEECLESSFELGPLRTKKMKKQLSSL
jgi:tetratricopeptide (TPR) repeat protein